MKKIRFLCLKKRIFIPWKKDTDIIEDLMVVSNFKNPMFYVPEKIFFPNF